MKYTYSAAGTQFTEREEGIVPYVYDDAVAPTRMWKGEAVHGHLTAGVGHLLNKTEIAQWRGKSIDQAQINRWFDLDNNIAEAAVSELVTVPLANNQADVLMDFVFNNNRAAFAKSTLLKVVNAGQFDKVPAQLLRWDKTKIDGKTVTSPGLHKRCIDRVAMWGSSSFVPVPHDISKPTGTPVATPTPKPTSTFEWASLGIGGISGVSSFASSTGFLGIAIGVAIIIGVGVGAFIIIRRQLAPK